MEIGRIHNRRFCRWRDKGIWEKLLEVVIGDPDYTWLMIDATFVKCHQHATGAIGGNQAIRLTKGGNSKIHLTMDANGMPIRAIITDGTTADCAKAGELIDRIKARYLFADKGYDSDEIINLARKRKMIPVIPPKTNRKDSRFYHKELYKERYIVENTFLKIKQWRGIATRYCKNLTSFVAAVQICSLMICSNFP
jgi:transposase